jgi:hypothetical protein
MKIRLRALPILAILTTLSACKTDPLALSDRNAEKVIERTFSESSVAIPLGRLTSVGDLIGSRQPDRTKGEVSQDEFRDLRVWEQIGVIKVSEIQALSKGFSGWNDFFALSQRGVQTRFIAAEGPKASRVRCSDDQRKKYSKDWGQISLLCVPTGRITVERIGQNEVHSIGTDHYRAIMGTYIATPSPIMSEFHEKSGQKTIREGKFVVALKHDPFSGEWNFVTADFTYRDSEFQTNAVKTLLGQN